MPPCHLGHVIHVRYCVPYNLKNTMLYIYDMYNICLRHFVLLQVVYMYVSMWWNERLVALRYSQPSTADFRMDISMYLLDTVSTVSSTFWIIVFINSNYTTDRYTARSIQAAGLRSSQSLHHARSHYSLLYYKITTCHTP